MILVLNLPEIEKISTPMIIEIIGLLSVYAQETEKIELFLEH